MTQRRDRSCIFRTTDAEWDAILSAVRASGARSASEFIREAVMRAVEGPDALEQRVEAIERRLGIGRRLEGELYT